MDKLDIQILICKYFNRSRIIDIAGDKVKLQIVIIHITTIDCFYEINSGILPVKRVSAVL